jgi:hypothetical protein
MSQAVRMLLGEGRITREQYERAVALEARHGETLTYHLVAGGVIAADELAKFMVSHFPCAYWPRSRLASLPRDAIDLLSPDLAGELRVIPLALAGRALTLGVTDPSRSHALDEAAHFCGCTIVAAVVSETDMTFALEKHYGIRPPGPFESRPSRPPSSPPPPAKHSSLAPLPLMTGRGLEGPGYRPPAPARSDSPFPAHRTRNTRPLETIEDEAIPLVTRAASRPRREDIPEAVAKPRGNVDMRPPVLVGGRKGGRRRLSDAPQPEVTHRAVSEPPRSDIAHRKLSEPPVIRAPSEPPPRRRLSEPPPGRRLSSPAPSRAEPAAARPRPVTERIRPEDVPRRAEPARHPAGESAARPVASEESWASLSEERVEVRAPSRPPAPAPPQATPRVEPAPAETARSEGEIIAAIDVAKNREDVVGLALGYMLRFAGRAVFLAVKKTEIRGFDIAGTMTSREAIRSFWVPISSPCTLQEVVHSRQIRLGPLAQTPADGVFAAALGGRPSRALVVPVIIRNRVAGLLYADGLDDDLPPWNRLTRLAEAVGSAFARLLAAGGAP